MVENTEPRYKQIAHEWAFEDLLGWYTDVASLRAKGKRTSVDVKVLHDALCYKVHLLEAQAHKDASDHFLESAPGHM